MRLWILFKLSVLPGFVWHCSLEKVKLATLLLDPGRSLGSLLTTDTWVWGLSLLGRVWRPIPPLGLHWYLLRVVGMPCYCLPWGLHWHHDGSGGVASDTDPEGMKSGLLLCQVGVKNNPSSPCGLTWHHADGDFCYYMAVTKVPAPTRPCLTHTGGKIGMPQNNLAETHI